MRILVFDIGGTSIKYGCCTNGLVEKAHETPTHASAGGRHIMDTVVSLIRQEDRFDAIGISTAGQVDSDNGSILFANDNIPEYTGMQIRTELERLFHVPVMVENDVNCAAIGEAVYGAGRDYDSFLCLTYGTGVGGAIIEHKKLWHGSSYSAGEFGGIVTHGSENETGTDLFDGCYERYASTTALVRSALTLDSSLKDGRAVFDRLHEPAVRKIVDDWIGEVLLGLISIIHIFNPPCIVLGGGIMMQPYITEQIGLRIRNRIMPSFAHVRILPALLGNSAGLLGISYLTEQSVFLLGV